MPAVPPPLRRARTVVPLLYAVLTLLQFLVPALGPAAPAEATGPSAAAVHPGAGPGSNPPQTDRPRGRARSTGEPPQVEAARRAGCTMAGTARRAARAADIPLYVGCAFLQQETGGGRNVFGHDPTVFAGAGEVTRSKYRAYKRARHRTGEVQGVGPMQLTWPTFQDRADRLGGAWRPYPNMLVGFRHLAQLHAAAGSWTGAAHDYNGSGPMARAYAAQMAGRLDRMRSALG
ncbi:hypothetical protein [Nocardioides panaciterrulae]|uniref:Lytic transglycosylase domain-containing protein n=1 Tax=Nocardioides panaciterrulae TaxID=661492 RepID=A0A7Y9E330_9ACTN|nr:hypothetical protein [Nocardioides panaciterrulae]NYD40308.1 hypothetical protein [Nocardioides panaciterrulae]